MCSSSSLSTSLSSHFTRYTKVVAKSQPKGWWNPGALLVTQSNVQDIITRQQSLEAKGRFYQPIIDKEFANAAAQIKPMDQAR